ncbi:MAG TPA: FkbM family methyltransferase [Stellaceae bacterium]|nr:FkbM family methyltransferase [Stellaceae bacterium]
MQDVTGGASRGSAPGRYYRFRFNPGFVAHLFKAVFKQHHRGLLPLLRPLVPEDGVVVDVGAHAGQFTKLFARLALRGFVIAVEPGSYARLILRVALCLNRVRNVAVLPLALGDRSGVAALTVPVKRSGSYGFGLSHLGAAKAEAHAEVETVAVSTLDEVVAALGLDRLDFVKADIEGFELRLILGGRGALARFRPALLLELDDAHLARTGTSLGAAWSALTALGYRPHAATPARTPLTSPRGGDVLWLPDPSAG